MIDLRIQQDSCPILLRFRTFLVAKSIAEQKLFRPVQVHRDGIISQRMFCRYVPEDTDFEFY